MADVDDRATRRIASGEEVRDLLDWRLRRGESDALERTAGNRPEPFEGQRQVRATASTDDGVDLVDDHRANRAQHLAAAFGGEEQVE